MCLLENYVVWVVQEWLSSDGKQNHLVVSYSTHKSEQLKQSQSDAESWRIPRELLVFSLHWSP